MPISLENTSNDGACIKVIGIGGGGGNAINNMINKGLQGVEFIAANTDKQALENNKAHLKIQLGRQTTRGLGAGANPEMGKLSVEENREEIKEALKGSDMIFITSGMGGGTGTGGAPMVAQIAQEIGALVVAIVTKPFDWEGKKRINIAEEWIKELRKYVDALIVIPNQKLLSIIERNTTFQEAYMKVDEVLYNATRGISEMISNHGTVNVDFADVQTIMKNMGDALMGIGTASGENRAIEATRKALNSPLLDGVTIAGSQGLLVNITGGMNLTMFEVSEAISLVEQAAGADVNLIHGVVYNENYTDEIMITVVATGFHKSREESPAAAQNQVKEAVASEQKTQVQNPIATPFGSGNTRFPQPRPFGQPNQVTETANNLIGGPKGTNQLKKFDSPAYARRAENNQTTDFAVTDTLTSNVMNQNVEHSAFYRKMLD